MALDQHVLQLFLNVVVITGVSSIATMWYLRSRDKQNRRKVQGPLLQPLAATEQVLEAPGGEAASAPALHTLPNGDQDIRQYVARRSRSWVAAAGTN